MESNASKEKFEVINHDQFIELQGKGGDLTTLVVSESAVS